MTSHVPWMKIGRVARLISGVGFPPPYQGNTSGRHPFLKVSDLANADGRQQVDGARNWVERETLATLGARLVPKGAIIFPKVGAALLKNPRRILSVPAAMDNNLMAVVPMAGNGRFWLYALSTIDLGEIAAGGALPYVNEGQIRDLRVPFPPASEQRRIANFLDAETTRIDRIMKLRAQQEETLRERFGVAVREQFDASDTVRTRLKFLLTSRPRYGVLVPRFVDAGIKFIRVNDLVDLEGRAQDLIRIAADVSAQNPTTVVREGDVLVSVVGTLGRAAVASASVRGANVNRAIAVLRPHPEVDRHLLTTWINAQEFTEQALLATSGDSAQRTLGMEDLSNFTLRWPSTTTAQARLAEEVKKAQLGMLDLRKALLTQLAVIKERRQALITAAVTGQFDVSTASGRNVTDGV
ncbi:restriction endonuclease subunit S [Streptomyces cyaneofuscatus]|uniref:restriction endonuclease subunit S n=1 Tax=Streptomyces cyaneofuscatus TaxID=66883 RepID=UPI00381C0CFE|nr:restriction endonuclease subunit S [Streptomyces cyaneofuscatus]